MSEWTSAAKDELNRYLHDVKNKLPSDQIDAGEVLDDLKRHIDEELAAQKIKVVTQADARRILSRIGTPESAEEIRPPSRAIEPSSSRREPDRPQRYYPLLLIFGVMLPLGTLIYELISHACALTLFDPIPSWLHVLLVTSVPVINFLIWRTAVVETKYARWLAIPSSFALGVALYYTLLFLPYTLFGLIGIMFFGLGLLPLSPLIAFGFVCRARSMLKTAVGIPLSRKTFWVGLGSAAAVLLAAELQPLITRIGLRWTSSQSEPERLRGLRLLRTLGDDDLILHYCYGMGWRSRDLNLLKPYQPSVEEARRAYYQVTGEPFNSVPAPSLYGRRASQELIWDDEQGSDRVGGRIRHLSALSSRQDALVDAASGTAYLQWTLEFKNNSSRQQEARSQIVLPPGSVVSRLTLWVNGEEREAAFAGRGKVREAYQKVVVQRRDPVLVTTAGPDRILVQCFPVPPDGGTMKIRLGVTVPLMAQGPELLQMNWPYFGERNFSLGDDFSHALWVQSKTPAQAGSSRFLAQASESGWSGLGATLKDSELAGSESSILFTPKTIPAEGWVPDLKSGQGGYIVQRFGQRTVPSPDLLLLVVDLSKSMAPNLEAIAEALSSGEYAGKIGLVLAGDTVQQFSPKLDSTALARALRTAPAVGGIDNTAALTAACQLAAGKKNAMVVWIHGPQPELFGSAENLRQLLERNLSGLRLIDLQVSRGPNRLMEKLDGLRNVRRHPVTAEAKQLRQFFRTALQEEVVYEWTRSKSDHRSAGPELSSHVARLWALGEVQRLLDIQRPDRAIQVASAYQLVTPVTGAVVLENEQQFKDAGLTPVDSNSVPVVPEPGTWALIIVGSIFMAIAHRRRRRAITQA